MLHKGFKNLLEIEAETNSLWIISCLTRLLDYILNSKLFYSISVVRAHEQVAICYCCYMIEVSSYIIWCWSNSMTFILKLMPLAFGL